MPQELPHGTAKHQTIVLPEHFGCDNEHSCLILSWTAGGPVRCTSHRCTQVSSLPVPSPPERGPAPGYGGPGASVSWSGDTPAPSTASDASVSWPLPLPGNAGCSPSAWKATLASPSLECSGFHSAPDNHKVINCRIVTLSSLAMNWTDLTNKLLKYVLPSLLKVGAISASSKCITSHKVH